MNESNSPFDELLSVQRRSDWISVLCWSTLLLVSLLWNFREQEKQLKNASRTQARTALEKDVLYRKWNAQHGGVYAPLTEQTPANAYLQVVDREIETPHGIKLTKINPAYMTRQVHELGRTASGVRGHITSLNPIRTENKADEWETSALNRFEAGELEVSAIEPMDGIPHMRLMRPLIVDQSCMPCHEQQGYHVGDIRGGISVSVPMPPLQSMLTCPPNGYSFL